VQETLLRAWNYSQTFRRDAKVSTWILAWPCKPLPRLLAQSEADKLSDAARSGHRPEWSTYGEQTASTEDLAQTRRWPRCSYRLWRRLTASVGALQGQRDKRPIRRSR